MAQLNPGLLMNVAGQAMPMPVAPQRQAPDLGAAVSGFMQARQAKRVNDMTGRALMGDAEAIQGLMQVDPQRGMAVQDQLQSQEQAAIAREQDAGTFLGTLRSRVGAMPDFETASNFIEAEKQQNPLMQRYFSDEVFDENDYKIAKAYRDAEIAIKGGAASSRGFAPHLAEKGGQKVLIGTSFNPQSNQWQISEMPLPEGVSLTKESAAEKREGKIEEVKQTEEIKAAADVRKETKKQSIKMAREVYEKLPTIDASIANIDRGLRAVEQGARTGVVERLMPSFRASTIELENVMNQMGLDVVSMVTFGALSASELKIAMDTAVPPLDESELPAYFMQKRKYLEQLRNDLEDAAIQMSKGMSIEEIVGARRKKREEAKSDPSDYSAISDAELLGG